MPHYYIIVRYRSEVSRTRAIKDLRAAGIIVSRPKTKATLALFKQRRFLRIRFKGPADTLKPVLDQLHFVMVVGPDFNNGKSHR